MTKLIFILLLFPFSVFGQLHFVQNGKRVISKLDSLFDFETANYAKDNAKLSFQTDSTQYMEKIINHLLVHYQKGKNQLKQSLVLNQLAQYNLLKLKKVKIRKIKNIGSLNKKNRQIIRVSKCSYGLIQTYTFTIDLIKLNKAFHRNEKSGTNEFNLYEGKNKPPRVDGEDEPQETPLESISYKEIQQQLDKIFKRIKIVKDLNSKNVKAFGYKIHIDPQSLKFARVPKVKVVLILGISRFNTQAVKRLNRISKNEKPSAK